MSKKSGGSKLKVVLAIVICIVLAIVVPTGIYCAVKHESPVSVVSGIFVSNEDRIIGKWQNEARTSAYEFKDNGTYESYFSTFSYTGDYTVKGDELTLSNPSSDSTVTYKIKVSKKAVLKPTKARNPHQPTKKLRESKQNLFLKFWRMSPLHHLKMNKILNCPIR